MQNIYDSWNQFHQTQTRDLNGQNAKQWLELIKKNTSKWNQQTYPQGEYWKYVKFNPIAQKSFEPASGAGEIRQQSDADFIRIDISNFSSPDTLKSSSLPQGLKISTHLDELNQSGPSPFLSLFDGTNEQNPFAQSALSFAGLGLVLKVEKSCHLEKPIKIVFDFDQVSGKDLYSVFNILLLCEEGTQSQFYFEIKGESQSGLSNLRVDARFAKESHTELFIKESGSDQSHSLLSFSGTLDEKASVRCFDFTLPGQWSRHNLNFDLNGVGAEVALKGAYLNNCDYFCDHHTVINHNIKETISSEDYRGILSDQARAVFNGKVYIAPKASQSHSQQINKNLMLSKKAEIDTKPELQIYNDDVKAAHGATVGQLDDEQRFYLQSRGYRADQARQVLARAFVFDLIETETDLVKAFYSDDLNKVLGQLKEL